MTMMKMMRVGRKKLDEKERLQQRMIRLSGDTLAKIEAKIGKRGFSAWVRAVIEKELKKG